MQILWYKHTHTNRWMTLLRVDATTVGLRSNLREFEIEKAIKNYYMLIKLVVQTNAVHVEMSHSWLIKRNSVVWHCIVVEWVRAHSPKHKTRALVHSDFNTKQKNKTFLFVHAMARCCALYSSGIRNWPMAVSWLLHSIASVPLTDHRFALFFRIDGRSEMDEK